MEAKQQDRPPDESAALARWFAEGVRDELAALEKDGRTQSFEVLSGRLLEGSGPGEGIFEFILADPSRLPEDATGRLKTQSDEFAAQVIGQLDNRIQLRLQGVAPLPPGIPRAILVVDDSALLQRLAEVLDEVAAKPEKVSPLATTVFHPARAQVGSVKLPDTPALAAIKGELRRVLEQAIGSTLTYVWGPPGTGKTFGIAHLVAALIQTGERVLVTSHTHAAVDQALYEVVKNGDEGSGPLVSHPTVRDGKVIRIGGRANPKVDHLRLDKVAENKGAELHAKILQLRKTAEPLSEIRAWGRTAIEEHLKLADLSTRLSTTRTQVEQGEEEQQAQATAAIRSGEELLQRRRAQLERAQRAWFRRGAKTEQAARALRDAETELARAEAALASADEVTEKAHRLVTDLEAKLVRQRIVCHGLPEREVLDGELRRVALTLGPIEEEIRQLQEALSHIEETLIAEARAIFCTLTKNYIGSELSEQRFDAVVVDEISMALPPLLFLAAGRATARAILVGDFLQLPPIVRSDTEISTARLGADAFELSGVVENLKDTGSPVLATLDEQRRMLPAIADVARSLAYSPAGLELRDHRNVRERQPPAWLDFLPANPLVIVDTADLHCWSGKQPGSLSRFNFYSATLAAELAAMAAAKRGKPSRDESIPIGIVTPFAAQKRLLSNLVRDMDLFEWVLPGTVHTFQGNEADLIVFDSVLDEPYYGARLCAPRSAKEVRRDLNVAVTRAKNKFVFVGSSTWLNQHAKPGSGLGELWSLLKERADLVPAGELVERGFGQRVSDRYVDSNSWRLPHSAGGFVHEILDETTFFERFAKDINSASKSVFGLVAYFGEYRWPRIQPLLSAALARGVEVTLVTPPLSEIERREENRQYVEKAIKNMRELGAVVVCAAGLHGKDIVIDERIHYTGSLNWASHRGRDEIMHRTDSPEHARLVLRYMQAKYIRSAAVHEDGSPRICPLPGCGWPIQVVNQRRQHGRWDAQAMKVGCSNPECRNYLRNIDERAPFKERPRCQVDGLTQYRRVRRGRGEVWQCPKHPKRCRTEKVVPGDPG